ncbi:hypothetical protein COLO4_22108 [Corchorus olitorius]|uniref:Splicing factor 3B subunit 4 n=1 Tax=Corchorus olitorius TaxID=93759 RepID=A0A1R3IP40_9ROSI|nr:hypothetical protein COLO4_22108 [Corchorus olitorius]
MTTRIAPGVGANLLGQHSAERNQDATAYVGNLDPQVSEELLWELFVQAGPVVNVYVPKDRVTNLHQGYGFVEFRSEEDADYAIKVLNMIKLYGKPIRVNKASQDKKSLDVGANLFIGNLDPDVDEKLLYDTFSAFGVIVTNPKIMRDPESGNSRGFGFISYDSFEASDAAIEAMNGQYLCNRQITVSYAYKKDTKGERHGTPAERVLAASNPNATKSRPHTLFASGPPTLPSGTQANGAIGAPVPPRPFANDAGSWTTTMAGSATATRSTNSTRHASAYAIQTSTKHATAASSGTSSFTASPANGNGCTARLAPTTTSAANGWKAPNASNVNATPSPTSICKLKFRKIFVLVH